MKEKKRGEVVKEGEKEGKEKREEWKRGQKKKKEGEKRREEGESEDKKRSGWSDCTGFLAYQ